MKSIPNILRLPLTYSSYLARRFGLAEYLVAKVGCQACGVCAEGSKFKDCGGPSMPSHSERVTVAGIIKGQGLEATCRMSALKVTSTDGTDSALTGFKILSVSESLPDGNYELIAKGKSEFLKLQNGKWMSA